MSEEVEFHQPGGVPITPQARRFGYEFPVFVSKTVWAGQCLFVGSPNKRGTSTERRITELLQYCYDGMTKKLAVQDDFISYTFKAWYWCAVNRDRTKKRRIRLGARLFLADASSPWLYIFNPEEDTLDELTKGTPTATGTVANESTVGSSEDSGPAVHLYGEGGDVFERSTADSTGEPADEHTDGQD